MKRAGPKGIGFFIFADFGQKLALLRGAQHAILCR
jgi:hypothetical protein